jgi:hypothetical protein
VRDHEGSRYVNLLIIICQYVTQSFNDRVPLTLFLLQCVSRCANSIGPRTLVRQKFYARSRHREYHRFRHQATDNRVHFLRCSYVVGHLASGMLSSATIPHMQAAASEKRVILVTFYNTFIFIIIILIIITLLMIVNLSLSAI